MEAGDCPTLNMNAMENYLLSHSLRVSLSNVIIASPVVPFMAVLHPNYHKVSFLSFKLTLSHSSHIVLSLLSRKGCSQPGENKICLLSLFRIPYSLPCPPSHADRDVTNTLSIYILLGSMV